MVIQKSKNQKVLKGGYREGFMNLRTRHAGMSRLDETAACYEKGLALGKDYIGVLLARRRPLRHGEFRKAVLHLDRPRRLNALFLLASLAMGFSFGWLSERRAAESCFQDVLCNAPKNREALAGLIVLYWSARLFEVALYLNKLLFGLEGESTA